MNQLIELDELWTSRTQCYSSENSMVTFQNLSTHNSEISCEHSNVYKKRCGSKSQTPEKCIPASEISSVVWICSSYHTWPVFLSLSVFFPLFPPALLLPLCHTSVSSSFLLSLSFSQNLFISLVTVNMLSYNQIHFKEFQTNTGLMPSWHCGADVLNRAK